MNVYYQLAIVAAVSMLLALFVLKKAKQYSGTRVQKRVQFIFNADFPDKVIRQFKVKYPSITDTQLSAVIYALKQYFAMHLIPGVKFPLAMPSVAADELWHLFILNSALYRAYCKEAFPLNKEPMHTPNEHATPGVSLENLAYNSDIVNTYLACKDLQQYMSTSCKPLAEVNTFLLFHLDRYLDFPQGYVYTQDVLVKVANWAGFPFALYQDTVAMRGPGASVFEVLNHKENSPKTSFSTGRHSASRMNQANSPSSSSDSSFATNSMLWVDSGHSNTCSTSSTSSSHCGASHGPSDSGSGSSCGSSCGGGGD